MPRKIEEPRSRGNDLGCSSVKITVASPLTLPSREGGRGGGREAGGKGDVRNPRDGGIFVVDAKGDGDGGGDDVVVDRRKSGFCEPEDEHAREKRGEKAGSPPP